MLLRTSTDKKGGTKLLRLFRVSCSDGTDSFAIHIELVKGGFSIHTHTLAPLSCHDTAHGATCVFVFVQWNIIAMQITEEWVPKHLMFSRIQWAGISGKTRKADFVMNQIC